MATDAAASALPAAEAADSSVSVETIHNDAPSPVVDAGPSTSQRGPRESSASRPARGHRKTKIVMASGGVALVLGAAGYLFTSTIKAFRRQQLEMKHEMMEACRQLRSAQEHLIVREQAISQAVEEEAVQQHLSVQQLSCQVTDAQRELAAAQDMCKQAANRLEQSMSDLSVTETELRAARTQLNTASRDLALTRAQLEATEGELGLSRSQNELMKRELDILRRQLREAGQQLEGYILVSRKRGQGAGGLDEREDDLALRGDWDT